MSLKIMINILVSCSLLLRMDCISAKENIIDYQKKELLSLLKMHVEIKSGLGSIDLINKEGPRLADLTLKFISNPKNKKMINLPEGHELQTHYKFISNYLEVKNQFEKCLSKNAKDNKEELSDQILQSAMQNLAINSSNISNTSNLDENNPCKRKLLANNYLSLFEKNIKSVIIHQENEAFQIELTKQILINTARSLLGFKYKFDPDFMKGKKLKEEDLKSVIDQVCSKKISQNRGTAIYEDACFGADPKFKSRLHDNLSYFAKNNLKNEKKLSTTQSTTVLNKSIDRINNKIKNISLEVDKGLVFDSPNLNNLKASKLFNQYLEVYSEEITNDAGPLLLTSTMKNSVGNILEFSGDDTEKDSTGKKFKYKLYQHTTDKEVKKSVNEIRERIQSQINNTLDVSLKNKQLTDKNIADLVNINPIAAGQILAENPSYSGIVCEAINRIALKNKKDKNFDKHFVEGMALLGGVLFFTGVGTALGGLVLTGSMATEVLAGTASGSILLYTSVVGTAVEVTSLGYYSKKSIDNYNEMSKLESAYLTNNSDKTSLIETKNILIKFKEARVATFISLLGMGLYGWQAEEILHFTKIKKENILLDEIKHSTKILNYINEFSLIEKSKELVTLLGPSGELALSKFLISLVNNGESLLVNFLEVMKDSNINIHSISDFVLKNYGNINSKNLVNLRNELTVLLKDKGKEKLLEHTKEHSLHETNHEINEHDKE